VQVDAHVAACSACAGRLQELRGLNETFAAAVGTIGAPVLTDASLTEVKARAAQLSWRERFATSRRTLWRAAILVIGLTGVAAATVPGSPFRDWLAQSWTALTQSEKPVPVAPAAAPTVPEAPPTGLRIQPADGRIRISLRSPAAETRIHVVLIDGTGAVVETTGGAAAKRTATGAGWLELTGTGAGDLRISLPRTVPDVTIEIDGVLYLAKVGDNLRYLGPTADTAGAELIFRPAR
jgi:hypothetical protein